MKTTTLQDPARRNFLKESAILMGGLVISFYLPVKGGRAYAAEAQAKPVYPPNAFIRIAADNSITIVVNKSEMGQGVYTSLPMLIAEELEADWSRIRVESSPVAAVYNHTGFGMQLTGGSSSIPSSWEQMRRVGASARVIADPRSSAAMGRSGKRMPCREQSGDPCQKCKALELRRAGRCCSQTAVAGQRRTQVTQGFQGNRKAAQTP